jgi:glyoxylate reductase
VSKILVTRKLPLWEEVSKPLTDAGIEVTAYPFDREMTRREIEIEIEKGYDGLLTLLTDKIDAELLGHDKNKQIKIIANYAVGFDNINVPDCQARGIQVTNTPCEEVNESVAEFTWALILALARRLGESTQFMRNAAYKGWDPDVFLGNCVTGKTLGLVGMGRIGGMVAKRADGFGVKVVYHNRRRVEEQESIRAGVTIDFKEKLDDLLAVADFVSLHVPLTAETTHLINKNNLNKFKKSAFLVNTARGPVVGRIFGRIRR